jgi:IS30 family transposase
MSLRNLGSKEQTLLNLYCNCQFAMSPTAFYAKWNVTHAQIATICGCSESTVDRWFQRGKGRQQPEPIYLRRLAEMDFLWENYEQLPVELRHQICRNSRHETL